MTIDTLRSFCRAMPGVTEDVKWGNDLVFSVAGKMFTVACLERPHSVSFKVPDEEFDELSALDGIKPAPYMARARWIQLEALSGVMRDPELRERIAGSYELVKAKLPKKVSAALAQAKRQRAK